MGILWLAPEMTRCVSMLDILIEDDRWAAIDIGALATRAVTETLRELGAETAELSLVACDDDRIAILNADFRGKTQPTNVLSWPETDLAAQEDGDTPARPEPDPGGTISLGDIAIAYDTCAREAAEQGKPLGDHATHLIVHGTLHLLGYDHIRDLDAAMMEALEVKILGSMGLRDPY